MQNYENNKPKLDDIKKLENLVNKLEIFDNFSLESEFHRRLLNEIFMLTQIGFIISQPSCGFNGGEALSRVHSKYFIKLIKNRDDFYDFESGLSDESYTTFGDKKNKWQFNNSKFTMQYLPMIEKEYLMLNYDYFHTRNSFKLFKLTVGIIDNRIVLEKEYINKQYMWLDPNNFFQKKECGW